MSRGVSRVRRTIRIWEKKRGARHTGSNLWGTVGEALFFGVLALIGMISLSVLLSRQLANPNPAVLTPGFGFWVLVLVLCSFTLLGGGGVIHALLRLGTSAERRSALAKRAASLDLLTDAIPQPRNYPGVPSDADMINSPGIRLKFRLPAAHSPVWQLSAATVFCLLWNGLAAATIAVAIRSDSWLPSILAVPFMAVGIWSIRHFLEQMLLHNGIGPTILEISAHPLYPGHSYRYFLSQSGRLKLRSLELFLVCEEEATYRQGTDVRTSTCVVHEESLFRKDNFAIEPRKPFELEDMFRVPVHAIHSFCSPHNRVLWKIVARGEVEAWPILVRSFPLVVYPPPKASDGIASELISTSAIA